MANSLPPSQKKQLKIAAETALCRANLFSASEDSYGPKYKDHFLNQYRLFIDSVNYTSALKLKLNTFFLTINTAIITAAGFVLANNGVFKTAVWHKMIPLSGILICVIWWGVIYTYKQRNIIKLRIVHCLEEHLPLALYKTEWNLMEANHDNWLKKILFRIDLFVPMVFGILYIIFALVV